MCRFQPMRQAMPQPTPCTNWNSFKMLMSSIVWLFSMPKNETAVTTHCKVHVIPMIFAMLLEFTILIYCVLTVQPWCFVCIFGTFTQMCKLYTGFRRQRSASGSWWRLGTTPVQPMNGSGRKHRHPVVLHTSLLSLRLRAYERHGTGAVNVHFSFRTFPQLLNPFKPQTVRPDRSFPL